MAGLSQGSEPAMAASPKPAVAGKEPEWMAQHLAHLFWGIQRQVPFGDPWNCEIQFRLVVHLMSAAAAVKSPIWTHGKAGKIQPPWSDGKDVLTVCFYAPAECGFYISMGWKLPSKNCKHNWHHPKHHLLSLLLPWIC